MPRPGNPGKAPLCSTKPADTGLHRVVGPESLREVVKRRPHISEAKFIERPGVNECVSLEAELLPPHLIRDSAVGRKSPGRIGCTSFRE